MTKQFITNLKEIEINILALIGFGYCVVAFVRTLKFLFKKRKQ